MASSRLAGLLLGLALALAPVSPALAAPADDDEEATEAPVRRGPAEPALFRGVVIETEPENAEIVASGRWKSANGRLVVPLSAEAYALPRSFTVTVRHRDHATIRKTIETKLDWIHFFMVAGPIAVVALGYAVPLLDPARSGTEKLTAGLTIAGTGVSIGQIFFQSHKFDDVYVIDLEQEPTR